MVRIEFREVSKTFSLSTRRRLLRGHLVQFFRREKSELFYALRDVSFRVEDGESVGIVGANGAGKSTLLGLVAGVARPDAGKVRVKGRVAALLELGSGFHGDLSGRENIHLNASLLGLHRGEVRRLIGSIIDFAGLGDFIDEPLRTYSSGMVMRLAFSVAVALNPDILIVDEVIAVGDQAFQAKCVDKIMDFRRQGKTLLAVSHAAGMLERLCDRALWLDHGRLMGEGSVRSILDAYQQQTPVRT